MFLVGIAAVVVKAIDLTIDYLALNAPLFDGLPVNDLPLSEVKQFTQRLDAQPVRIQPSTLIRRLRSALDYLSRKGTTENLEDELRSLADLDAEPQACQLWHRAHDAVGDAVYRFARNRGGHRPSNRQSRT